MRPARPQQGEVARAARADDGRRWADERAPVGRAPAARVARGHGVSKEAPKERQEERVKDPVPAAQLPQAGLQDVP